MHHQGGIRIAAALAVILVFAVPEVHAAHHGHRQVPWISIIIDDIGYRRVEDFQALDLPGPLAFAIMPHSPHAVVISRLADKHGKDVLLHLPMQAVESDKNRFLGPGALTMDMNRRQFVKTLADDLHSFPNIIGINNHMGSLLTQQPGFMEWLMHFMKGSGKFYLDSVTTSDSVAGGIARENRVPYLRRDIFLDDVQDASYVEAQFDALIATAKRKGHAIAIGHPHPETLAVLARRLPELYRRGVILVSLRQMLGNPPRRHDYEPDTRLVSADPSHEPQ